MIGGSTTRMSIGLAEYEQPSMLQPLLVELMRRTSISPTRNTNGQTSQQAATRKPRQNVILKRKLVDIGDA
jgi:hypothetical protein